MLILSRKKNQNIIIDNNIVVSIIEIKGDLVKLGINAPGSIKVYRQEVYDSLQEENRQAINSQPASLNNLKESLQKIKES